MNKLLSTDFVATEENNEVLSKEKKINNYMRLIKLNMQKLDDKNKQKCVTNILCAATDLNNK